VTDPRTCQSRTLVNVLGQTVESDHQGNTCGSSPTWLSTNMEYDVASRLLSVTDPLQNTTTFAYDGMGRKTSMTDPDLGHWTYGYDSNGNLTSQLDARGATILMYYDALNRMYLKDLPYLNGSTWTNGAGVEDEYTYYDSTSNLPASCYSCDDHCSTTTDTCNTATLSCTNTGTPCGPPL